MSAAARPLPELTGLVGEFHELLATGTLHLQHCDACDRWWYPAKLLCPGGADHDLQWRPARGTGSVFSWTVTHQALQQWPSLLFGVVVHAIGERHEAQPVGQFQPG